MGLRRLWKVSRNVITWLILFYCPSYVIATFIYGTAHVQVYKLTRVTCRASRNFACDLRVGLVRHEKYTAHEQLLMS